MTSMIREGNRLPFSEYPTPCFLKNNRFLQEIVQIWSEVNFDNQIKTKQQFLEPPIWHNSLIRINDNPVYYKHIFLRGISKVSHLMKDSRIFLSLPEFSNTYNIRIKPQGPEEICLSLEYQNPSKTSEIMGYFDRVDDQVTVSLHILYTANQETEGSQDRLTV